MLHSPFKIFLAGFGSVDFSFGSFVAGLPESMRQDQSPTYEEKTQDSIGVDLELKDLVRCCSSHASAGAAPPGAT
jgi:hypothetical protein